MPPRYRSDHCQLVFHRLRDGISVAEYCLNLVTGQGRWRYCSKKHAELGEDDERNPDDVRRSRARKHLIKVFPDLEVVRYSATVWSRSEILKDLQRIRALSPPVPFLLRHAFTKDGMLKEPGPGLIPAREPCEALKTYYFLEQLGRKSQEEYILYLYRVIDKSVFSDLSERTRLDVQLKRWKRRNRWCRLNLKLELFDGREAYEAESIIDTLLQAEDITAQSDVLLAKAKKRANDSLEKMGLTYPLDISIVAHPLVSKDVVYECKI